MSESPYDADLPFLADLEERVRARAEQTERQRRKHLRTSLPSRSPEPGDSRRASSLAARMTRRSAILVGLVCLLGATAFGARSVFVTNAQSPPTVSQSAPVLIVGGRDGADSWTLHMYTRGGELCRALIVLAQVEASRCASPPTPDTLTPTSAVSTSRRYVFGVTGNGVRAVRMHVGSSVLTLATHALGSTRARAVGTSPSTRYFLGILPRPLGERDPPATVIGLDASNRRIDGPRASCPSEAGPPACEL